MSAYAAEWAAFVAAITNGADIPATLSDGINALAMAEAATQSAKTGLPVKLSGV
jgi:myo-inositol 2-dehydrogenase/D-chiro-inositol 1-dehydrogenase